MNRFIIFSGYIFISICYYLFIFVFIFCIIIFTFLFIHLLVIYLFVCLLLIDFIYSFIVHFFIDSLINYLNFTCSIFCLFQTGVSPSSRTSSLLTPNSVAQLDQQNREVIQVLFAFLHYCYLICLLFFCSVFDFFYFFI